VEILTVAYQKRFEKGERLTMLALGGILHLHQLGDRELRRSCADLFAGMKVIKLAFRLVEEYLLVGGVVDICIGLELQSASEIFADVKGHISVSFKLKLNLAVGKLG
jgi:hypothetical protein